MAFEASGRTLRDVVLESLDPEEERRVSEVMGYVARFYNGKFSRNGIYSTLRDLQMEGCVRGTGNSVNRGYTRRQ